VACAPEKVGDPQFKAVLRIDPLLKISEASKKMKSWNYAVEPEPSARIEEETASFVTGSIGRRRFTAVCSSDFRYPVEPEHRRARPRGRPCWKSRPGRLREQGFTFAMMIGKSAVNPARRAATCAENPTLSVVNLCREFPKNKFFVTIPPAEPARACVAARKFGNLMVFGCWWFLNNPSLIEEIDDASSF
jgi:hypothetical protein